MLGQPDVPDAVFSRSLSALIASSLQNSQQDQDYAYNVYRKNLNIIHISFYQK